MEIQDQEEKNRFPVLGCIRTAMQMTGRHARTVLDRLSRLFSRLNCMDINVDDGGSQYSRKLTEREKAFVVREVKRNLDLKLADEQASRSSSYDSLADETLSIRASTLTSPATSIGYSPESGTTTDSSSFSTYEFEHIPKEFSYRGSCSPSVGSPLFTTPVRSFSTSTLEGLLEPEISNSLPAVLDTKHCDVSSVVPSLPGSPVSYYRSSTDLNVEDDTLDDGFWDAAPPKY